MGQEGPIDRATDLDLVFETPLSELRSLACDAGAHGIPLRVD